MPFAAICMDLKIIILSEVKSDRKKSITWHRLYVDSKKNDTALEQRSLYATTIEPVLWSPGAATTEAHMPRACAQQQEKPPQWEALALQLESSPRSPQLEERLHSNEDPAQPRINTLQI